VIVEDVGEAFPVLLADRGDLRAELRRTHVDDLQPACDCRAVIQLNQKLKAIAALYEQAALESDTCLADI
jgi:hypothetical protein